MLPAAIFWKGKKGCFAGVISHGLQWVFFIGSDGKVKLYFGKETIFSLDILVQATM